MLNFHSSTAVMHFMQILVAAFLAILFLQSGIDKIFDWRGNLDFVKDHFARSPLARMAAPMFGLLTILELAAGALSAVGCLLIVLQGDTAIALDGALIAAIAITALFFGQRVAKDYPGAAILVSYFLLTLVAIYLLRMTV
ncbi:MAG: DoxX family protein [Verrucomicrobia bacterium]|nr:MAG: DoxX family protein [Verrucomicrobiota bacterium]